MQKLISTALVVLALGGVAKAGFPLIVDDSDTNKPGEYELETDAIFARQKGLESMEANFSFTTGLTSWLEGSFDYAYGWQRERHFSSAPEGEEGFGDLSVGLKSELIEASKGLFGLSLSATAELPTAQGVEGVDGTNVLLAVIASHDWTKTLSTDFNLGFNAALKRGGLAARGDAAFVGVGESWKATDRWMLFAETYDYLPTHASGTAQQILRGGVQLDCGHQVMLAAALATGYGETHFTGLTLGVDVTF